MQTFFSFVFVFGIIVLIHEFGHFYFAKKSGVLVREFSIGMGPKLFQVHKNETTYTLRVLPLGGYVMMAGYEENDDIHPGQTVFLNLDKDNNVKKINLKEERLNNTGIPIEIIDYDLVNTLSIKGIINHNTDEEEIYNILPTAIIILENGTKVQIAPHDRQFQNASLKDRILINLGGPLSNFILSIVTFTLLAFINGGVPTEKAILGDIQEGSAASETQLQTGDEVLSVNNKSVQTWTELVTIIQDKPNEELTLEVQKPDGEKYTDTIIPKEVKTDGAIVGQIGVYAYLETSFIYKLKYGFIETWSVVKTIFSSIVSLFSGKISVEELGGPVAIYNITGEISKLAGFLGLINFIGFLSANLGLMNLLPIPGLDGGKLVLNIYEGIRGEPLSENKEVIINMIGVIILLLLMLFITWNDIQRYFFN